MRKRLFGLIMTLVAVLFAGCDDSSDPGSQGGLGEECYPNQTCDSGLVCQPDNTCLQPNVANNTNTNNTNNVAWNDRTDPIITNFSDALNALELGSALRISADLSRCEGPSGASHGGQLGMIIDVWEYFGDSLSWVPVSYVSFSDSVTSAEGDSPHILYRKGRVYADGRVQFEIKTLDAATYTVQSTEEYICDIADSGTSQGARIDFVYDQDATLFAGGEERGPMRLSTFQEIKTALIQGRQLYSVLHYNQCTINGYTDPGPDAIGGTRVGSWSHYGAGAHPTIENNDEMIEFFQNSFANIYGFGIGGFVYNWVLIQVYDDDHIAAIAEYLHPQTYDVEMHEFFICGINTPDDSTGGASIYAY